MTNLQKILAVSSIIVVLLLGLLAYSVFKTPAAASGPITAIPLAVSTAPSGTVAATTERGTTATVGAITDSPVSTQPETVATAGAITDTPVVAAPSATALAQTLPTTAASATSVATTTSATTTTAGTTTFTIVPAQSEVRFSIAEVLNGSPKTAIGTTNQVAGELAINPQAPAKSRAGTIQVDARTLATDSDFRNRAIKNQILQTDQYEFITFVPNNLTGLPQQATIGQSITFQLTGNLTIRTVTKAVTFAVTVTPTSATQLKGSATTTISRANFGLTIPQVRQVANVSDQVHLAIDFVAVAK